MSSTHVTSPMTQRRVPPTKPRTQKPLKIGGFLVSAGGLGFDWFEATLQGSKTYRTRQLVRCEQSGSIVGALKCGFQ